MIGGVTGILNREGVDEYGRWYSRSQHTLFFRQGDVSH